mmetsp:Transcript_39339/g.47672  ORF Transcript_39339/g.47672 Transcript_39339/m.47672 type:complete len:242 (-) Transcript_39339:11-736(-)|eukprot:CAMPEP_0197854816 /NCGR_PEP_ID=MMETSP1438-20131217/25388_1 /TAXON_ID=1461541 /ORGANISM="Pterosperma sp., Strain CCMP1384" /LENGTH=241 /DNA_ID=CAMNT_0043469697 /DNA_START=234 /DNA_END=959 /DNA_ORIENTATION=+
MARTITTVRRTRRNVTQTEAARQPPARSVDLVTEQESQGEEVIILDDTGPYQSQANIAPDAAATGLVRSQAQDLARSTGGADRPSDAGASGSSQQPRKRQRPSSQNKGQDRCNAGVGVVDLTADDNDDDCVVVDSSAICGRKRARGEGERSRQRQVPAVGSSDPSSSHRADPPPPPRGGSAIPVLTCVICLDNIEQPWSTPCGHVFCKTCITDSVKRLRKCPTCRAKVSVSQMHRLYLPTV